MVVYENHLGKVGQCRQWEILQVMKRWRDTYMSFVVSTRVEGYSPMDTSTS